MTGFSFWVVGVLWSQTGLSAARHLISMCLTSHSNTTQPLTLARSCLCYRLCSLKAYTIGLSFLFSFNAHQNIGGGQPKRLQRGRSKGSFFHRKRRGRRKWRCGTREGLIKCPSAMMLIDKHEIPNVLFIHSMLCLWFQLSLYVRTVFYFVSDFLSVSKTLGRKNVCLNGIHQCPCVR